MKIDIKAISCKFFCDFITYLGTITSIQYDVIAYKPMKRDISDDELTFSCLIFFSDLILSYKVLAIFYLLMSSNGKAITKLIFKLKMRYICGSSTSSRLIKEMNSIDKQSFLFPCLILIFQLKYVSDLIINLIEYFRIYRQVCVQVFD